jgi:hypothetical protein
MTAPVREPAAFAEARGTHEDEAAPPRARRSDAMTLFAVGEESNHHIGNVQCPECWEEYPEPCRCGGLMHAAGGAEEDTDGNVLLTTRCDRCGRSENELDEP